MEAMMLSSSSPFHLSLPPKPLFSSPLSFPSLLKFKGNSRHRVVLLPAMCIPGPIRDAEKSEDQEKMPVSSSSSLSPPSSSISPYNWCAGLGGLGFLETAYLTYLKVSNTEPFCPVGGVPLPLIGMTAYGLIFLLGLKLRGWNLPLKINQSDGRLLLLVISSSMAAASAYFLFTLATRLEGVSCSYCLVSATLSFSLFFIILKEYGLQELQKVVALPLCTAAIVLGILNTTYNSLPPILPRSEVMEFPYYTTEITSASSPYAISVAKHLKSIGAKMYGAFWCSHCQEQKEMFGREAMELLDYVECFPDGVKKGIKMASVCSDVGIEGFPTWLINGKVISGEKTLEELAEISDFHSVSVNQAN